MNEGICEERETFWNDMDRVGNKYRSCMLGDLNGWIGDRVRAQVQLVLLEFQERMKMGEEWWSSVLKGGCLWITHNLNTRIHTSAQGW